MTDDLLKKWQELEDESIYLLFSGKDASGREIYAYLQVPYKNLPDFVKAVEKDDAFLLETHATILYWNYGTQPPEEVQAIMAERHGFDHGLDEKLGEKLKLLK
jgi:hypothetical protein